MSRFGSPHRRAFAVALGLLLLAPGALRAQTAYAWNVGSANWGTSGSWTPGGGPPGALDSAAFNIVSSYTATLDSNRSINNVSVDGSNTLAFGPNTTVTHTSTTPAGCSSEREPCPGRSSPSPAGRSRSGPGRLY